MDALGLTSYAIAKATGDKVGEDMVRNYVTGRQSITSGRLQHVLDALGLTIRVRR